MGVNLLRRTQWLITTSRCIQFATARWSIPARAHNIRVATVASVYDGTGADLHRTAGSSMRLMLSIQVIHFIRHGEGFHNVAGRRSTEEYKKEDYADAHLTELGWTQVYQDRQVSSVIRCRWCHSSLERQLTWLPFVQAHALQKHIAQLPDPLNVEAVIVSPLSRALQTAVGAFGGTSDEEGTAKPLMLRQAHILVSVL